MGKQGKTEQHNRLVRTHVNNWAGRLLRLAGADITTTGKENIPQGPVVFVANHQGYFDIPLMLTQLDKPNPLVAKKEIQKIPMIRGWMEQLHCVFWTGMTRDSRWSVCVRRRSCWDRGIRWSSSRREPATAADRWASLRQAPSVWRPVQACRWYRCASTAATC